MQKSSLKCKENAHCSVNIHKLLHYKVVPQRQSVNQQHYNDTIQHLLQMWQKRPEQRMPGMEGNALYLACV
jgi:hypothetical protein